MKFLKICLTHLKGVRQHESFFISAALGSFNAVILKVYFLNSSLLCLYSTGSEFKEVVVGQKGVGSVHLASCSPSLFLILNRNLCVCCSSFSHMTLIRRQLPQCVRTVFESNNIWNLYLSLGNHMFSSLIA